MAGVRLVRAAHHALVLVIVFSSMLVLSAQTVVDPRYVEFNASADHNRVANDGITPLVSSYSLSLFPQGSTVAFATVNLGKPTPDGTGLIRVDFLPLLPVVPTPGVTYTARVTAVGPGGSTDSTASNGFYFSVPCAPSISPITRTVSATATTGTVSVTAGTGCGWSAVSNAAWITLTGGASGSGNGSVSYSVAANSSSLTRVGTMTIAGATFTLTQTGVSCSVSVSPSTASATASGGPGSASVTAPPGCTWTAVSNATSWLTVTGGASGSGNGTVSYSVAANSQGVTRQGAITIGGQTFTVDQAAAPCSYAVSPGSTTVAAAGGTGSTAMTATPGCAWTAVSSATWLTVTGGASGTGNGTVTFSAAANAQAQTRQATITIGGQTFTVNQAAAPCTYSITPASTSAGAGATTGSTSLTTLAGCTWTAVSNATSWLTVTNGASGSGNGTVSYSIAANPNGTTRQGTITIGGQTFTVNQTASPCTYSISPGSTTAVANGGTGSTAVTATPGCTWTAVSNSTSWLTVTGGASGTGNGTVSYSVAANPQGLTRQGTITIAGQTFTVDQAAAPCSYSISPGSTTVAATGGTGSTAMTATPGCAWTAVSSAPSWLTVTGGATGTGNGTVTFAAAANGQAQTRQATITIGGQTFTVNQSAAPCTYSITPGSTSVGAGATTGSTNLTTLAGCTWTAVSNATSWLTVTSGASGTGNGTVSYSIAANPNGTTRQGTITIGGQTFTVNQAAACIYSISPGSATAVAGGGTGSTAVTATAGCSWTASSATSWLTVTGGASGSGNGTVTYSVAANPQGLTRQGTITIAGQTFTVDQAAAPCSYAISPGSTTVAAGGGTGSTTMTATPGCSWTAVSSAPSWLTVTSGASGSGNGTVTFSVAANSQAQTRQATIAIGGQTFTVNQSAAPCTYSLTPASTSVGTGATTGATTVTAPAGCTWTAVSNATAWLTVTGGASGNGNGTVSYSVTTNPQGLTRQGTITIGGQSFIVNQAAAPCVYSISPGSTTVVAGGGTGSTDVTATPGCSWTAVSSMPSWLTVTGGASGSGNGTVTFSAAANPQTQTRQATIAIAGQTFTVNQAAAPCTYALTPATVSIAAGATSGTTAVTSPSGCAWTATSGTPSWLSVTAGASGNGNGTVTFAATANPQNAQRVGTISIGGQTFTVNQAAAGCTFTVSPVTVSVAAIGGNGTAIVTTPSGCTWTAVSNTPPWLTVTGGASGSGGGTVSYSVATNPQGLARQGTMTIGGQTVTVDQAAAPCTYAIAPTSASTVAAGGTGSIAVSATPACSWTAVSSAPSWLALTGTTSDTGDGSVTYTVAVNTQTQSRQGTITIAGQTFTVTQAAMPCTYSLSPSTVSIAAGATSGTTTVTAPAGCTWTAATGAPAWLTVTAGASGSGNGTVTFAAAANTQTTPRAGTLTIGGQTFTVNQAAAGCSFSLAPTSASVAATGGTGTIAVSGPAGCAWSASSSASWVIITAGGSGNGNGFVMFSAAANTLTQTRQATLTVGGQVFTVNQPAATCSYSITPTSLAVVGGGGTGSVAVSSSTAACTWTSQSNVSWITLTSGSTGTGNGSVTFAIEASTVASQRTGTLTIAGRTFTVTQGAGNTCPYSLSPQTQNMSAGGGTATAALTTNAGCIWTATTQDSWIRLNSLLGWGPATISYTVLVNSTGAIRTGRITVAGQTLTITQPSSTPPASPSGLRVVIAINGGSD